MANEYLERLRSVGVLKGGRTQARVVEGRRDDGVAFKATTDELGNTVTEHNTKEDRVDVTVRPQITEMKGALVHGD
jgi:hypothetical protein